MIIASVSPGVYYLIEDDTVIGNVRRTYDRSKYTAFPEYVYLLTALIDGSQFSKIYKNLPEIHHDFDFENYPGYGAILKTQKEKKKSRYTKRERRPGQLNYVF